jgi:hypothetical protein
LYTWLIPDGSIPPDRGGDIPPHEAICFVNPTTQNAEVRLDVYFVDREPIRDVHLVVPAERSAHLALGEPFGPGGAYEHYGIGVSIPAATPFSLRVRSEVKLGCQYTRVQSSKSGTALMSTYIPALRESGEEA